MEKFSSFKFINTTLFILILSLRNYSVIRSLFTCFSVEITKLMILHNFELFLIPVMLFQEQYKKIHKERGLIIERKTVKHV